MKILVATDGSPEAAGACRFLRALPLPAGTLFHIVSAVHVPVGMVGHPAPWQTIEVLFEQQEAWAEKAVREAQQFLAREGMSFETYIPRGDPAPQILQVADTREVDLVVVGAHGLTGPRSFLGSVARSVVKRCRLPVLIAREPKHQVRTVVAATDGSAHARHALRFLSRLPLPADAQIIATHVMHPQPGYHGLLPGRYEEFQKAAEALSQKQAERGTELLVSAETALAESGRMVLREIRTGDPASEILRVAEERNADLIVAGARGVSLLEGFLMGSVADRLVKQAPCSVLIVH